MKWSKRREYDHLLAPPTDRQITPNVGEKFYRKELKFSRGESYLLLQNFSKKNHGKKEKTKGIKAKNILVKIKKRLKYTFYVLASHQNN